MHTQELHRKTQNPVNSKKKVNCVFHFKCSECLCILALGLSVQIDKTFGQDKGSRSVYPPQEKEGWT